MDRYEEALERAKKGLPIDEVFPELKESEDEKIRKELLEEIEFIIPHDDETDSEGLILPSYHARIDRYKSYLEKQKEQKPIFKKGDKVIWDDEEFNILDVNETEYNVGGYRVPFSRQNELHPIWQKSAEWSEEDEKKRRNLMSLLVNMREDRITEETYQKYYPWLKSLRSRPKISDNWKPSEEQMAALKYALGEGGKYNKEALKSLLDDLKKL